MTSRPFVKSQYKAKPMRKMGLALSIFLSLPLQMLATQASAQGGLIRDTEIETYLKSETRPVLTASGLDPDKVHFLLVADRDLNAFASSNLLIALNTGLIEAADTPNQLLGVVAHEAGHLTGGHLVRTDEIYQAAKLPTAIAMGIGIIGLLAGSRSAGAGQAGMGILASSQTFGTLGALHYMQTQESAADLSALKSLERAGMSGQGLVDFFDKFRQAETFTNAESFKYFRSHPLSRERILTLRKRVSQMAHFKAVDSEQSKQSFAVIKAKLSGFLDPNMTVMSKYPLKDQSYPARYARVIAAYKQTKIKESLEQLDGLLKEQPNNPYLWELKGQIYFETAQAKLAKPAHEKAVSLLPEAPLLLINLGQTLMATGDKEDLQSAIVVLKKSLLKEPDSAFTFSLLAEAYDSSNQPGLARLSSAEAAYYSGDMEQARTFAVWSQKNLDTQSPEFRRARDIVLSASSQMGISPVDGETQSRKKKK